MTAKAVCKVCGEEKPRDRNNFYHHRKGKLHSACIPCVREARRRYDRSRHRGIGDALKICRVCQQTKSRQADFAPSRNGPGHTAAVCRSCQGKAAKAKTETAKAPTPPDKADKSAAPTPPTPPSKADRLAQPTPAALSDPDSMTVYDGRPATPPEYVLLDIADTIQAGDLLYTCLGWKPVHPGDAAIGHQTGGNRVARSIHPPRRAGVFYPTRWEMCNVCVS